MDQIFRLGDLREGPMGSWMGRHRLVDCGGFSVEPLLDSGFSADEEGEEKEEQVLVAARDQVLGDLVSNLPTIQPHVASAAKLTTIDWQMDQQMEDSPIDQLPDSVLVSILSSVNDAKWLVRCAVLSKRFNSLVWQVPDVRFGSSETFEGEDGRRRCCYSMWDDFEEIVTDTVMKMTDLQSLTVVSDVEYSEVSEEAVEIWLKHAGGMLRSLKLHTEKSLARDSDCTIANLDMVLRYCSTLEVLDLSVGRLRLGPCNNPPLGIFKRLTELKVTQLVVEWQADLSAMLASMPRLETLMLELVCGQFRNVIDFPGPSLKRLVLSMVPMYGPALDPSADAGRHDHKQKIVITAPNLEILELTVHGTYSVALVGGGKLKHLQANVWFATLDLELSPEVKTLETLVMRANLESGADNGRGYWKTWDSILSRFNDSLQKLTWGVQFFEDEEDRVNSLPGYPAGGIFRNVVYSSRNAMPGKRPIPIHPLQFCRNFHELRTLSIESSDFVRSLERGFILLSKSIGQKCAKKEDAATGCGKSEGAKLATEGGARDKEVTNGLKKKPARNPSSTDFHDNDASPKACHDSTSNFEAMSCLPKLERLLLQLESVREVTVQVLSLFLDESPSLRNVFVCTGKFQRAWSGRPEQMCRLQNLEQKYSRVKFRYSTSATSMDSQDFLV
ncbi:hypothetical protein CBR_g26097 [Chara braunii]|uniref:F-box domain-containing protein n=1 Tax=Chara braunii TaxID=69332 RepID=A0A388JVT2_CHABU|nr:hypothetical protein CBR_g26097 [Chara braunii]|eukprot:GBG61934.1 hypothetical protein CBR_g26097 [Chara braunii]